MPAFELSMNETQLQEMLERYFADGMPDGCNSRSMGIAYANFAQTVVGHTLNEVLQFPAEDLGWRALFDPAFQINGEATFRFTVECQRKIGDKSVKLSIVEIQRRWFEEFQPLLRTRLQVLRRLMLDSPAEFLQGATGILMEVLMVNKVSPPEATSYRVGIYITLTDEADRRYVEG